MKAIHNINPIYNENSQVLILGSMPSILSRKAQFFYVHSQNRFWKIMEILFNIALATNEDKEIFLLQNNIALWDVISSCEIKGSSDSSIKNIQINDLDKIINLGTIKAIFCTGKTSYKMFNKYFHYDLPVICLPSPSSANAKYKIEDLVNAYQVIFEYLDLPK